VPKTTHPQADQDLSEEELDRLLAAAPTPESLDDIPPALLDRWAIEDLADAE
jgi:hypothetical protein